jgi:hypothetical protein
MRTKLTDSLWEVEPGYGLEVAASSGEVFLLSMPSRDPRIDYEQQKRIASILEADGYPSEANGLLYLAKNALVESCIRRAPSIRRYRILRSLGLPNNFPKVLGWWSFYSNAGLLSQVNGFYLLGMADKLLYGAMYVCGMISQQELISAFEKMELGEMEEVATIKKSRRL